MTYNHVFGASFGACSLGLFFKPLPDPILRRDYGGQAGVGGGAGGFASLRPPRWGVVGAQGMHGQSSKPPSATRSSKFIRSWRILPTSMPCSPLR